MKFAQHAVEQQRKAKSDLRVTQVRDMLKTVQCGLTNNQINQQILQTK